MNYRFYQRRDLHYAYLSDSELIDRMTALDDDLKQAYEYYQTLLEVLKDRNEALLDELLQVNRNHLPQELQKAHNTLRNHKKEIIASLHHHYSNGPVEGVNNRIKVIKRTAYGFRNYCHFRLRILLAVANSNLMFKELNQPKRGHKKAHPSRAA